MHISSEVVNENTEDVCQFQRDVNLMVSMFICLKIFISAEEWNSYSQNVCQVKSLSQHDFIQTLWRFF